MEPEITFHELLREFNNKVRHYLGPRCELVKIGVNSKLYDRFRFSLGREASIQMSRGPVSEIMIDDIQILRREKDSF